MGFDRKRKEKVSKEGGKRFRNGYETFTSPKSIGYFTRSIFFVWI